MVLNGKSSHGHMKFLSFLACINDLLKGWRTNAKPFSDDTSLFSVVRDSAVSSMSFNDEFFNESFNEKFLGRLTNGTWYLTQMPQNRPKKISGFLSDTSIVECGVPQGSTLGPLLFLLYINGLANALKDFTICHFADV